MTHVGSGFAFCARSLLGATALLMAAASNAKAQGLQPPPPLAPPATPYGPAPGTPYGPSPALPYGPPGTGQTLPSGPSNSADESEDSGLGLEWLWAQADIGIASTSMDSLNSSNLSLQRSSSFGPAFGFAVGARFLFFTVGVRARDLALSDWSLWELDGEAAFHMRIDHFDPYLGVRGGYATSGSSPTGAATAAGSGSPLNASVHGGNAGFNFGLDYYFNHFFSLGVDGNPEFLFLERPPVPLPASIPLSALTPAQHALYEQSGSSIGFGFVGTAHVGLHF